jgi:hypothetical protein
LCKDYQSSDPSEPAARPYALQCRLQGYDEWMYWDPAALKDFQRIQHR